MRQQGARGPAAESLLHDRAAVGRRNLAWSRKPIVIWNVPWMAPASCTRLPWVRKDTLPLRRTFTVMSDRPFAEGTRFRVSRKVKLLCFDLKLVDGTRAQRT